MIQDDGNAVLVKHAVEACFLEFIHRHRSGDIVAQDNVQLGADQLSCRYGFQPRVGCQDLLGHGHSHNNFSFIPESYCCRR